MPQSPWGPESFTICTTEFFNAHRSIQVWQGSTAATGTFLATYDRFGEGMNSTFQYLELVSPPTNPTIDEGMVTQMNNRVNEYVTQTGAGVRLVQPFSIPGEVPGDGIGSLLPSPDVDMALVIADPNYNMVDNNCVTAVAQNLNKIRARFEREGISGALEFDPRVPIKTVWVLSPIPPTDVPPELQQDVDLLRAMLWDEPDPSVREERLEQYAAATGPDGYMILWSCYSLDAELSAALPIWQQWAPPALA